MLKPINPVANRIADGRRFASRSIVLSNLSAIACFVFRRQVVEAVPGESREETIWEGGMSLSDHEEHATEYVEQGYAMMLFDKFSGGSIHSDGDDINPGEAILYAQIEPFYYADYQNRGNMMRNVPDWKPKKGDVFAMLVADDLIKWVECVGVTGQSLHAQHGERYVLNVRDSLMHLEPFKNQEEILMPQSNIFPLPFAELMYSDAPIFEVEKNDPSRLDDDEIAMKKFKLVNLMDPELQQYHAVLKIKHLANRTNSPYMFGAADQEKITVNVGNGEAFILSSEYPVKALETPLGQISYVLVMIDHIAVVREIAQELAALHQVQVKHNDRLIFEILPLQYDQVRKAYHFVCPVILGQSTRYDLNVGDQVHSLTLDAVALQGEG